MRRFIRWWRALLALGVENREIVLTTWSDPSRWTAAQRRAFAKSIDKGLDELAANRRRKPRTDLDVPDASVFRPPSEWS